MALPEGQETHAEGTPAPVALGAPLPGERSAGTLQDGAAPGPAILLPSVPHLSEVHFKGWEPGSPSTSSGLG